MRLAVERERERERTDEKSKYGFLFFFNIASIYLPYFSIFILFPPFSSSPLQKQLKKQ